PTDERWPAKSQDGVIATVNMNISDSGKVSVDQPLIHPTWVDKDHGWVIRSIVDDLDDPGVSAGTKAVLEISRLRTASVLGDYFVK
ncbi:MAG: hypothetical protein AAB088_01325, partial [Actinomycetota bacterium]